MLSYEGFVELVKQCFGGYFGQEIVVRRAFVGNKQQDVCYLKTDSGAVPSLRLQDMYHYLMTKCQTPDAVAFELFEIVKQYESYIEKASKYTDVLSLVKGKKIYAKMVNTEKDRQILESCYHKEFLDLSMLFYFDLDDEHTCLITRNLQKLVGLSDDDLYNAAMNNAQTEFEYSGVDIWSVEDKENYYGAANIFFEKTLDSIYDLLKEDFYILPAATTHVCVIAKSRAFSIAKMKFMVVNGNLVVQERKEDVISNNLYYYSRKERRMLVV